MNEQGWRQGRTDEQLLAAGYKKFPRPFSSDDGLIWEDNWLCPPDEQDVPAKMYVEDFWGNNDDERLVRAVAHALALKVRPDISARRTLVLKEPFEIPPGLGEISIMGIVFKLVTAAAPDPCDHHWFEFKEPNGRECNLCGLVEYE